MSSDRARGLQRPVVAIPGRFAASAVGLRHRAVVVAERLAEAVFVAGGEPLVFLPTDPGEVEERLSLAHALILPGGNDLSPATYGEEIAHPDVYGLDRKQDDYDLASCRFALANGVPLLAICRGMQVLNVALGGSLHQHLEPSHRDLVHSVRIASDSRLAVSLGATAVSASCFHHQGVARLGRGLVPVAFASDDVVEGLEREHNAASLSCVLGVQWHPEDTWDSDPQQLSLFRSLAEEGARRRASNARRSRGPAVQRRGKGSP